MKMQLTKKIINSLGSLALVTVMVAGCTKKFERLNTQPSLVSEDNIAPEFLLSGVQYNAGGGMAATNSGDYCGMTVRQDNAPFVDEFDDGPWYTTYTTLANNLAAI